MLQFRPHSDSYLAKKPSQLEKCTVSKNSILVTRSGTVGRCVIVGERLHKFAISDDAIRVEPAETPLGYLYAFLMSWIGQALLTKNQYGSAIKHLEPHHISGIPVPLLPESEMNDIADCITTAYSLREEANQLLDDATNALYDELELPKFDERLVDYLPSPSSEHQSDGMRLRAYATMASQLDGRLDASYHLPLSASVIEVMRESGRYPLLALSEVCENVLLPGRFKRIYVKEEFGVPFIQGSHIPLMKPYDLKFISRNDRRNVKQCTIGAGWVMVTCSGTVGRIGIVPTMWAGWLASQHIIRLVARRDAYSPGFIATFLMTPFGQHQLLSKIYGAVVDELTAEDVELVLIPDAPKTIQDNIGDMAIDAFEKKEQANVAEDRAIRKLEDRLSQR